ncbi:hypothetical protein [Polyangium mundeleinium]|uniref:Uncharacterized protein n=1 Tax=Polyangium mundeleinium TaxID=2995306 RepID=A0ABT5EFV9_9BACT|nr:hypothetical protein [Polyangium mundeleinium]MDC0740700.1 hypothetical protein [Polyangium mundeleinium]
MPCFDGAECIENLCKAGLDGQCEGNHQCKSNRCLNGFCAACMNGGDCGGPACTMGACPPATAPDGAYCIDNDDCISGSCTGFPPRCAPP